MLLEFEAVYELDIAHLTTMTWAYRIFNMNCFDNYSLNHVMVFIIFRK